MFDSQLTSMGVYDYRWLLDRTQKTDEREKRPDECFFPYEKVDDDHWELEALKKPPNGG